MLNAGTTKKLTCAFIIFIILALVIVIGCCIFSSSASSPLTNFFAKIAGDKRDTIAVPGDANKFDVISNFSAIQKFAGDNTHLISIEADYVSSDGTLNLNANYTPAPNAVYKFYQDSSAPKDAPPVGAGGSDTGKWYIPVTITVHKPGASEYVTVQSGGSSSEYFFTTKGIDREPDNAISNSTTKLIDSPKCSFKQLWDVAITKGAKQDAVATIKYDNNGYEFQISNTAIDLTFSNDCKLQVTN